MIASLRGLLAARANDSIVIDVSGVGYEVFFSPLCHERLPREGEEVFLHIQTIVREDAISLYGFLDQHEKRLFVTLLGVSGVGPRLAMNILAGSSPAALCQAISADDITMLKRLPGVGKKTAERLCLELKDKVDFYPLAGAEAKSSPVSGSAKQAVGGEGFKHSVLLDVVSALLNLGYNPPQARAAVERLQEKTSAEEIAATPLPELLRAALRMLAIR